MERWRVIDWIDGYRGTLEVSDAGRVRRSGYTYTTKIGGALENPSRFTKAGQGA